MEGRKEGSRQGKERQIQRLLRLCLRTHSRSDSAFFSSFSSPPPFFACGGRLRWLRPALLLWPLLAAGVSPSSRPRKASSRSTISASVNRSVGPQRGNELEKMLVRISVIDRAEQKKSGGEQSEEGSGVSFLVWCVCV